MESTGLSTIVEVNNQTVTADESFSTKHSKKIYRLNHRLFTPDFLCKPGTTTRSVVTFLFSPPFCLGHSDITSGCISYTEQEWNEMD